MRQDNLIVLLYLLETLELVLNLDVELQLSAHVEELLQVLVPQSDLMVATRGLLESTVEDELTHLSLHRDKSLQRVRLADQIEIADGLLL